LALSRLPLRPGLGVTNPMSLRRARPLSALARFELLGIARKP
jgi:hypothetical protein